MAANVSYHERLGRSNRGDVFRVTWKSEKHGTIEAAASKRKLYKGEKADSVRQEIEFLKKLHHRNIIKFYDTVVEKKYVLIMTEYAAKGSLYHYLKGRNKIPADQRNRWIFQLASGIHHLKENNIVHRNLNSTLCLISADDVLVICGFGRATYLTTPTETRLQGTAPEAIRDELPSPQADIIAFGIIVWEIVSCDEPYKQYRGVSMEAIMYRVCASGLRPTIPEDCPVFLKALMEKCWHSDYMQRPSSLELLQTLSLQVDAESVDHIPEEILARGIVSLTAYKNALQSGKKAVYRTRLMFVGQERVGKTSLKKRLIGKRFDPQESITDGIDASNSCHVSIDQVRNWSVDLSLGDVHVQGLAECMAKDLRTVSVDTKPTIPIEQHQLSEQVATPQLKIPNQRMREVTHGATKVETVTNPSISDTTKTEGTARKETMPPEVKEALFDELLRGTAADVKREAELSLWDFAGQELYYVTHQVFLSKRSVVLIVFNLAEIITQKEQQNTHWLKELDFWMHSIYAFTTEGYEQYPSTQDQLSPPIILVGTHRNQLDGSPDERKQLIKHIFETIEESLRGKCYRKHVVHGKFAVDNSEDSNNGIVELQAKIESVAKKEPYMGEEIPLRWLKFEESVKSAVKNGVHFLPIHKIKSMHGAREIPSTEPAELSTMLQFYHDLGIIMYHPKATSSLCDLVILDPQWLISVFKSIITVLDKDKRRPVDKDAWERLENEGVLEDSLISHMWRDVFGNGNQTKEALLDLMEKYDLLVKQRCPNNATDASPSCYYVPSRLQMESDSTPEELPGCTVFYVDFFSFLPAGIFYRLMARAVEWSQQQGVAEQPPVLGRTKSSFVADDCHQFELLRTGNMIMVTIVPEELVGGESRYNANPETTTKVKSFLESALSNLKAAWAPRIKFRFVFKCPCAKGDEHYLDLDSCLDDTSTSDNIQCCKKKRIAKKVIREKFCLGMTTQKLTARAHPEDCYEMCHNPRGLCCIINNMDFHLARQQGINLSDRGGSEKDADALETTFSRLQFVVDVKNNLTAAEIVRHLQNQANKHDRIQVDCFVCCILTHGGNQGILYGVNGAALDIKDATSIFKSLHCPGLTGKPKLFFIQACRGSEAQICACHVETDDASSDVLQQASTLPNEADFLLGYATVSGFVSYRSTVQGSWYIQTLTDIINKHSSSLELLQILTKVNYEVSKMEAMSERYKQIPAPLYTLRKSLHFV